MDAVALIMGRVLGLGPLPVLGCEPAYSFGHDVLFMNGRSWVYQETDREPVELRNGVRKGYCAPMGVLFE